MHSIYATTFFLFACMYVAINLNGYFLNTCLGATAVNGIINRDMYEFFTINYKNARIINNLISYIRLPKGR